MFRIFNQYVSAKSLLLMLTESFLVALSLVCAVKLRFWNNSAELWAYTAFPDFAVQIAIVVVVCFICFYCNDLYDLSTTLSSANCVLRVEQSIGAASLLLGLFYFLFPGLLLSRGVFIIGMALATCFVVISRKCLDKAWKLTAPVQHVLILGTDRLACEIAAELTNRGDLSIKVEGFVRSAPAKSNGSGEAAAPAAEEISGFPVLGSAAEMQSLTREHAVSKIIVALEERRGAMPTRELVALKVQGVRVEDAASALSALTGRISLRVLKPSWLVFSDGFHRSPWNEVLKRALDLFFGIVGLVLSLPLMLAVAIAVRLDSSGPAFYRQTRVGRMGKCFELLKFRSMIEGAENHTGAKWAGFNDPRITRVGRFLRKYRLDELPQFWNVICGDMSFVGPRPERPCFVEQLRETIPYYDERHSVRPGLTGWAQVQYSYGASVEDAFNKLEYDLFYLKNMSLTFDLAIVIQTIRIVIAGRGGR